MVDASFDAESQSPGAADAALGFADILRLTSQFTVARILERDDFSKRYAAQHPISLDTLDDAERMRGKGGKRRR